jgi:hypothetical protein
MTDMKLQQKKKKKNKDCCITQADCNLKVC